MWHLFLAVASAGPAELTLSGLPAGSAAAVWLKGGEAEQFAACNDAGTAPDAAADGVYTCGPLAGLAPPTELFLLHESGVAAAGDALDGGATRLHLGLDGATLRVETSRPAAPGTGAGGAGRLLLIHLVGAPSGPLPMLTLSSPSGSTQLRCRDDGGFPDLVRNDNQPGCSGRVLTPTASLSMNSSAGPRSLGALPTSGELLWVRVDATAGTITPETEAIPLPGRDLPPSSPPPPPGEPTPPPGTPTLPAGEVSPPSGAASEPPPPPVASGLAWLGAAVLAIAAAFAWRRKASRNPLPSCLEPVTPRTGEAALPTLEGKGLIVEGVSALAAGEVLLARAAATRRVILVAHGAVAPPTDTAGVWRSSCVDSLKIARAAGQLASTPGAPVAVVVVGADIVRDPGAIDPHPLANLLGALAPGIWLGVAVTPGEAADCELPRESTTS
jgi:hypothetical protein